MAHGRAPALYEPCSENGERRFRAHSWNDYRQAVEEIAAGLRQLGVRKGETVALDSETRLEFYLADMGVLANGCISAALYPNYPARDLVRTIEICGATTAIVEDAETYRSLRDAPIRNWILMRGEAEGAIPLAKLRECGRSAMAADPGLLAGITAEVSPADYAVLYLTSGATGEPKMALVTHDAIVSNIEMAPPVLPLTPRDRTVAFLPSAHIAQRVVIEYLPLISGMPVYFSESLLKLPQDIKAVKPTLLLAPPRMWERIYSSICTELRKKPKVVQKMFWGGLALGLAAARYRQRGKPVPKRIAGPLSVADRLLFRKVRARLGGELTVPASGAAPLSKELSEFYDAIGMPIVEGYGLTEGGVVALNPLGRRRSGTIGKAMPGVEMRIAGDGELLVKSPTLMSGYYRDPGTTAEVLRNGWLHTGDLAFMDDEGFIFITGRKKELIVSSTGKKIFPSRVEGLFRLEPLISQVVLIGDGMPHIMALFTINGALAETLKGMDGYQGGSSQEIAAAPPVLAEVQKIVARVNKQLAPFEQVRKYRVLGRDFSIEEGELTATMKVRRNRVMENFRDHIDELCRD